MTRHGKNCTAGSVYTYHERKKDTEASGYGSQAMRMGKDSIKEFDCCCLSLQPCRNPVVTPDGFLYDKEILLENIIHQKREIARKLKEFERQKKREKKDAEASEVKDQEQKLKNFLSKEGQMAKKSQEKESAAAAASLSNVAGARAKALPSFWIPALTPQAAKTTVKKPDERVRCPMSGKPLKLKDLTDVVFTHIKDGDDKKALIVKDARYVCAVTNDVLGNSVPCAVLRTSGAVVTLECIDKILRKEAPMRDPINGKVMADKDIIPLQRGATGFAGAGVKLEAKVDGPALQA